MAKIDNSYHKLIEDILKNGYWYDDPYREGVKRLELGSYTFEHDFSDGFPAMTTKKLYWKGIVGELIWFLRGWTNIKYLVDNKISIWNKDAYKHYLKFVPGDVMSFDEFVSFIEKADFPITAGYVDGSYKIGDLGKVYGGQWRDFTGVSNELVDNGGDCEINLTNRVDQINDLIRNMIKRPLATDLLVNAWNPADNKNVALPPCHYGFQILGRPLSLSERVDYLYNVQGGNIPGTYTKENKIQRLDALGVPKYGFDLKWNQRSVDTFLGLPFNIASYALLAKIIGNLTNTVPLKIIGNLSKVHIYDNAIDDIKEQLSRSTDEYGACKLQIKSRSEYDRVFKDRCNFDNFMSNLEITDFKLEDYKSFPPLKVEMLERDE